MNRRLYRCRHDKRIAGVASGIAEYFDADPSLVRILWVLSIFVGGAGLLLYIAMALIVPLEPEAGFVPGGVAAAGGEGTQPTDATGEPGTPGAAGAAGVPSPTGWSMPPAGHRHATHGSGRATTLFGIVLIMFGALAFIDRVLPNWADGGHFLWPAFIVGIGVILVASAVRRDPTAP